MLARPMAIHGTFQVNFHTCHSRLLPAGATGNPHDRRHARIHDLCDDPWDPCHARTLWIPVPAWIQQGAHPSESQPGIPKHPLIAACFRQSTRSHPTQHCCAKSPPKLVMESAPAPKTSVHWASPLRLSIAEFMLSSTRDLSPAVDGAGYPAVAFLWAG